jgi:ABC-2 type transport system ATP-binding protein
MCKNEGRKGGDDLLNTGHQTEVSGIVVDGVSKWYGDVVALSDVSFRIEPGVTALLGPNGAGKSTLFKILSGLIPPSTGKVVVRGKPVRSDVSIYRQIALVPENEHFYSFLTAREFVRLNATLQGVADADAAVHLALARVDLLADAERRLSGFSKGMRQRGKIAAALVHEPKVMILDEPLNGTDPLQRLSLIDLFRAQADSGCIVVVSSHVLNEVERFADSIVVIMNGKLVAAGDYRAIREKLDEHSHVIRVRASDPRKLAAALVILPFVRGVRIESGEDGDAVIAEADNARDFYRNIPLLARTEGIRLYEVRAMDDTLASVFAYVTRQ